MPDTAFAKAGTNHANLWTREHRLRLQFMPFELFT